MAWIGGYGYVKRPDGVVFRRGDHVRLNSGGPLMTIVVLESDGEHPGARKAVCHWLAHSSSNDPLPHIEPHIGVASFDVAILTKQEA